MNKQLSRFVVLATLSLLLICSTVTFAADAVWKEYIYSKDGFAITAPSEPILNKQMVNTKAGPFELRTYIVAIGNSAFMIGATDYNIDVDPQKALPGARDGAIKNVNGKLVSEHPISLGGYPGIEFDSENAGYHMHSRIYLVGRTLYQIVMVTERGKPFPAETTRLFDSFRFVPRK